MTFLSAVVKPLMTNGTVLDVVVKQGKSKDFEALVQSNGLSYSVSIQDLQAAINEENPQLTEEEMELVGRKGNYISKNDSLLNILSPVP